MKALNSTLVACRAGGRVEDRRKTTGEREKRRRGKIYAAQPIFQKAANNHCGGRSSSLGRSLARFGNINVRTNERGTHNKYEFLYCPPAAMRRRHWRHGTEQNQGAGTWGRLRVQNYEIVCFRITVRICKIFIRSILIEG